MDEWLAIEDRMPPGPPRLRVGGVLQAPTSGYQASLTKAEPQSINRKILLLNLNVTKPTGEVLKVITPLPVRYEEEVEEGEYTQVTVQGDGELLKKDKIH
jgi:hypothetical protein